MVTRCDICDEEFVEWLTHACVIDENLLFSSLSLFSSRVLQAKEINRLDDYYFNYINSHIIAIRGAINHGFKSIPIPDDVQKVIDKQKEAFRHHDEIMEETRKLSRAKYFRKKQNNTEIQTNV